MNKDGYVEFEDCETKLFHARNHKVFSKDQIWTEIGDRM